ncbi:MAG: UDP-N-acetylglucosamine 1-carboxyvinyltransferase [Candidatus Pacebacteria bacterium]|nr:UDP-N-acetylglucosamine 1-carboxyvinyltransferase [Candidatus Paceibacterota bacterium]
MNSFLIKGLGKKKKLEGTLRVNGAKNAVLKAQAASVLFKEEVVLKNVPFIEDFLQMNCLLGSLGVEVFHEEGRTFRYKISSGIKPEMDLKIATLLRSSVVLTGPILAREGRVFFPHPGGCVIGKRPIDVFLDSFKEMGAGVIEETNFYRIEAKKLKGADIFFKLPSVTATETLMMAAVLAYGKTILRNVACEPEIAVLANFLNASGADIKGAGTNTIEINGRSGKLLEKGVFETPPDRVEAGSFAVIASILGKNLRISDCDPSHMRAELSALKETGVDIKIGKDYLLISAPKRLTAVDIKTHEYPGFSTDMQAPFSVLLTQAEGKSMVFETVFDGRLNYLNDLERMGAKIIICDPHRAIIEGPTKLRGRKMESPDLRAGLAFLTAALAAEGESEISNIYNIDRGYEKIEERLSNIGATIKRI